MSEPAVVSRARLLLQKRARISDPTGYDGAMYGAPALSSINPTTAVHTGPNFTLHALGTKFDPGSVIWFGGVALATTYISAGDLSATINTTGAVAGTKAVQVKEGAYTSVSKTFTYT